jgi:hypothetical protein
MPSENGLGPGMELSGQIWHIYGEVRDFLEADEAGTGRVSPVHVRFLVPFWKQTGSYLGAYLNDISTIRAEPQISGLICTLRRHYGCFEPYDICNNLFTLQKNGLFSGFYWGQLNNSNPSTTHTIHRISPKSNLAPRAYLEGPRLDSISGVRKSLGVLT